MQQLRHAPAGTRRWRPERRQRRFLWFCIALSIFCAVMIVWLPRYLF